jgi:hypothetical protein
MRRRKSPPAQDAGGEGVTCDTRRWPSTGPAGAHVGDEARVGQGGQGEAEGPDERQLCFQLGAALEERREGGAA